MNAALWKKSIRESRWLLLGAGAIVFAIHWLRVWISSFFTTNSLQGLFSFVPEAFEQLMPVSFTQMSTATGRIAVAYDDPLVLVLAAVWSISRGSDAVSGELNRGTMEMVLSQPVRRAEVLGVQAAVTVCGAAALAAFAWLGTLLGLACVTLEQQVSALAFVPAALNLFALMVFLAGLTTLFSSGGNYRSRTIGAVGGIFAVSMILKIIGRLVPGWHWLSYLSFLTPFEPQRLVGEQAPAWSFYWSSGLGSWGLGGLGQDSILIGLGLVCYVAAVAIFCHRDLPAPL